MLIVCKDWQAQLIEMNGQADHVHLLLGLSPQCSPRVVANDFKTVRSRLMRKAVRFTSESIPPDRALKQSYFLATVVGSPLALNQALHRATGKALMI